MKLQSREERIAAQEAMVKRRLEKWSGYRNSAVHMRDQETLETLRSYFSRFEEPIEMDVKTLDDM